jgi:hypothetical protein
MRGRRVPDGAAWYGDAIPEPGAYGRVRVDGEWVWRARAPSGAVANLERHDVTEHEDGTITVSPSILVTGGGEDWHGFLERGVWRWS